MLVSERAEEAGGRPGEVEFLVASNPEFLRKGSAIYDSLFPDRIVVGSESREAIDTLRALYEPKVGQSFPTQMDPRPRWPCPSSPQTW
jgi:UDPglucose 6-dehydrogenase